ncbi:hypothetical protein [Sodalis sp. (in: enterobacteria)]|uniref:hypothetical protein n=1 Tax=Sodalis sp. (in: enterobacteria) TaxID=1898979 RepID=UPI003F3E5ED1
MIVRIIEITFLILKYVILLKTLAVATSARRNGNNAYRAGSRQGDWACMQGHADVAAVRYDTAQKRVSVTPGQR